MRGLNMKIRLTESTLFLASAVYNVSLEITPASVHVSYSGVLSNTSRTINLLWKKSLFEQIIIFFKQSSILLRNSEIEDLLVEYRY